MPGFSIPPHRNAGIHALFVMVRSLREVAAVIAARAMVTLNIVVLDALANGVWGIVVGIDSIRRDAHAILVKFDSEGVGKQASHC